MRMAARVDAVTSRVQTAMMTKEVVPHTSSLYIVTTAQLVPVLIMTRSHDMQCCHDVIYMLMNNSLVPIADILH